MICQPDFSSKDFNGYDFQTTLIDFIFGHFIPDKLPVYFRMNDSYKDKNGDGLLMRYLTVFGDEIDQEIIPTIECYINIIDAQKADAKFLTHISDVLGNPPDVFGQDDKYRNLLSYICSIYKIKGTKVAYELFFSILGFDIDLVEIEPNQGFSEYDDGGQYDNGLIYDVNRCEPCSEYDITFYPKDAGFVLTPDIVDKLKSAIKFNEPINARLRNLTMGIKLKDTLKLSIKEKPNNLIEEVNIYDVGNVYDDNIIYDRDLVVQSPPLLQTSMTLTVNKGNGYYELLSSIYHNFEGLVDLTNTNLLFRIQNKVGKSLYAAGGSFTNISYPAWRFNANVIKDKHTTAVQLTDNYMRLTGTIVLENGMQANINTLINLGKNVIPLYFI